MQNLHGNLAALRMNRLGEHPMATAVCPRAHAPSEGFAPSRNVGRKTTRHNETDPARRPFAKIRCKGTEIAAIFQPRVHRTHEHAIAQGGESEVQG